MPKTNPKANNDSVWSIILAGGEGERTRPFIEQWLGFHRPKQYCTFVGNRSMIRHTLDRADRLGVPHQKITVVSRRHEAFLDQAIAPGQSGRVIWQPDNRDTVAGVFLPLTYVRACNPQAIVAIFPSDHFVFPEDRFVETVKRAVRACDIWPDRLFLLGVRPSHLELEYGWINVGGALGWSGGSRVYQADSFLEKPNTFEGLQALANGAFWNTMVMIAKVETLWKLGQQFLPSVLEHFEELASTIGTRREGQTLTQIYQQLPTLNFSRDLLQQAGRHIGVIELEEVLWSDWGCAERIVKTLELLGKEPVFPTEILERYRSASRPPFRKTEVS
jgi:mannose-1-phosphate guanylyltransferase